MLIEADRRSAPGTRSRPGITIVFLQQTFPCHSDFPRVLLLFLRAGHNCCVLRGKSSLFVRCARKTIPNLSFARPLRYNVDVNTSIWRLFLLAGVIFIREDAAADSTGRFFRYT